MPRKKGRIAKDALAAEAENQLRDNIKETLEKFWLSTKKKLDAGDPKAMEMVARMVQYDKGPGGVTIFNQHLQVTGAAAANTEATARVRSFDQIIGKLEEQDNVARANRLLNAPVENSEDDDLDEDDIAEAEFEEASELVGQES